MIVILLLLNNNDYDVVDHNFISLIISIAINLLEY